MPGWGSHPRQLYTLVSELHKNVRGRDDVSLITGLSVVKSLDDFVLVTGGGETRLQEIACVYDGLDESVVRSREKTPNQIINSYTAYLQPLLKDLSRSVAHKQEGSYLLRQTLNSLQQGHGSYPDQLRRRASRLIGVLYDIGPASGSERNAQLQDHYRIEKYFVGEGL